MDSAVLPLVVALSGLAGAALTYAAGRVDARRKARDVRLFRNLEERRRTGADYLVALDAYRRCIREELEDRELEPRVAALARRHADLARRMELYFDRAVRDCVADTTSAVNSMHDIVLGKNEDDFQIAAKTAEHSISTLVKAIRLQLGERDD